MAIVNPQQLLNYDDYVALGDEQRYEVLDGVAYELSTPSIRHQRIVMELGFAMYGFVKQHRLGELFAVPMDHVMRAERPATIVQPDIAFIARENKHRLTKPNVQGAPDLAVEVLSPSTARRDRMQKLALFARFGVQEVWFIPFDVDRVEVMKLRDDGHYTPPEILEPGLVLRTDLLPGFEIPVADIFPREEE